MKHFHILSVLVLLVSTALSVVCLPQNHASSPSLEGRTLSAPTEVSITTRNNRFLRGLKSKLKKCVTCGTGGGAGGGRGQRGGREPRAARNAIHPGWSPVHLHAQGQGQGQAPPVGNLQRQDAEDMNAFLNALEHIN